MLILRTRRRLVAALGGGLALLAASPAARADITPPHSTSFEAPDFVIGSLDGQGDWVGDTEFEVTAARAHTGTQSVLVDTAPFSGGRWNWPFLLTPWASTPATPWLVSTAWIFIDTDTSQGTTRSVFGLDAYTIAVDRIASLDIDADGVVSMIDSGGTMSISSLTVTPNQWNKVELILNTTLGLATSRVNGQDTNLFLAFDTGFEVSDVDLRAVALGFETGFFDDYSVVATAAAPEPGTLALAGLGALAAAQALRRRRRSA